MDRGQGALEYLIIIAAVIAIAAIVILFLTGALTASRGAASLSTCKNAAAKCKTELVTSIDPPCPYCYDTCVNQAGEEIFDGAYNMCLSGHPELIYEGSVDTTPPTLSNVDHPEITDTRARITWNTDEPATGIVNYAKFDGVNGTWLYDILNFENTNISIDFSMTHDIYITGLESGETYFYEVWSFDGSGNNVSSYGLNGIDFFEFDTLQ